MKTTEDVKSDILGNKNVTKDHIEYLQNILTAIWDKLNNEMSVYQKLKNLDVSDSDIITALEIYDDMTSNNPIDVTINGNRQYGCLMKFEQNERYLVVKQVVDKFEENLKNRDLLYLVEHDINDLKATFQFVDETTQDYNTLLKLIDRAIENTGFFSSQKRTDLDRLKGQIIIDQKSPSPAILLPEKVAEFKKIIQEPMFSNTVKTKSYSSVKSELGTLEEKYPPPKPKNPPSPNLEQFRDNKNTHDSSSLSF